MALNFPAQPQTVGTPYEAPNGVTYIWDGVKWVASGTPGSGGSANLGNLYVVDQAISGLNEGANIYISGNVVTGNVDALSFHAESGFSNGGGFRFLFPEDPTITGLVHSNLDNTLALKHQGSTGLSIYPNGNVKMSVIAGDHWVVGNLRASVNIAAVGTRGGYRFIEDEENYRLTTTGMFHDLNSNTLRLVHENFNGIIMSNSAVAISNLEINGTSITTDAGTLYVDGIAVGGAGFASELAAGDYTLKLYPNGNTVIPGTISSSAAGIPEFNSSTDLNLTAANRVNIVNSPLNLGAVIPNTVIGKPGDIIYHPALQEIQAYINGAWENLLRTAENQNVRLPQGGAYQRSDGVRAAWFTELPTDISQLTDNNNLLTSQSITLQNIDIDGGGAYSIYEVGLMFADGGFGSSRFGPSDTVFDGAGADSGYTNSLNGGGA